MRRRERDEGGRNEDRGGMEKETEKEREGEIGRGREGGKERERERERKDYIIDNYAN